MMSAKVKISKESAQKAEAIIAFQGYASLEEMVEDLIQKEYDKIKAGDNKEELAKKLSGLGYIS